AKNEAESLPQLVDETVRALRSLESRPESGLRDFEIVVVDDGSTDHTPQVLDALSKLHPELRPVTLRQNVGQSGASMAGFWASHGEWIGMLDADLQNDPADLITLWQALPGYDAALGWRRNRQDTWFRRAISLVANGVRNAVLGQAIRDTGCSVRIFKKENALRLPMFHGAHRFFGPLLMRDGCRIVQVPVNHRAREFGRSHYNLWNRSIRVVVDLLGVAWLMRRPIRFEVQAPGQALVGPRSTTQARVAEPRS
ncbi:MAG TPA: glycosyltransferase family 2 protein, partial [Isosphaeraceae bacterium]|nr:glycosyltransferase family 2 protein [Isosphaeraceae bacterium]